MLQQNSQAEIDKANAEIQLRIMQKREKLAQERQNHEKEI